MRRAATLLSVVAVVGFSGSLLAHEGHEHTVMGTVTQVHQDKVSHVEVKTTDDKTVVLTCDEETKFFKGDAAATLKDVQAGSRIVATVTEEGKTIRAWEVRVGEADGSAKSDEHQHQH